ncbi:hypothetical protein K461DRAFT_105824 [Myriangium duriaei CBS 260.36]|uniref:Uncharacterized protein n=1 Tax=Myriangium duriaei CBS 260.36 TaxID=1168546 RepID=A0A9P4J7T2_9PEZI|nr:hypothetical protein K461DRAFT_105824 [Myriangium duriaei CBS 260.36]
MVKLLDLNDDGSMDGVAPLNAQMHELSTVNDSSPDPLPQARGLFRLTAYYPVVSEIATGLDLTSLDQLSQTCRQVRVNLLQHRSSLISKTLRCRSDGTHTTKFPCARDLVGPCQRCGLIYCRNCIAKPKHTSLSSRHRRLCKTCIKVPLSGHMASTEDALCNDNEHEHQSQQTTVYHGSCMCGELMWFCEPCERQLRSEDTSYMRGWSWRRRYSHTGIGIGEGEQGVPCGREGKCLDVREVEVEIDADQFERPDDFLEQLSRGWSNTSYRMQEIEGIGGVVKKKVKKRVSVGHVVKEYEDERVNGEYLRREQAGKVRSWCAHCNKVIPGVKDTRADLNSPLERLRTSSGSSTSSV